MATRDEIYTSYLNDPAYTVVTRGDGNQVVTLSAQERLETLGRWADHAFAAQQDALSQEQQRELRRDVRRALTALDADIARLADTNQGLTIAQARPIMLRMARIEEGLIQALVSLDLLEDG